jgi:hypothetical protein
MMVVMLDEMKWVIVVRDEVLVDDQRKNVVSF